MHAPWVEQLPGRLKPEARGQVAVTRIFTRVRQEQGEQSHVFQRLPQIIEPLKPLHRVGIPQIGYGQPVADGMFDPVNLCGEMIQLSCQSFQNEVFAAFGFSHLRTGHNRPTTASMQLRSSCG